jgi:UDP:flavonoid glycosyltransferase YjiC (YdhE family)
MSKRVLLAWELGAGRGHLLILGWIADALRQRGYEPLFALQRLDGIATINQAIGNAEVYQSPVWPGLLDRSAFQAPGKAVSFGDVIGGLGLTSPVAVEGMVRAWERLIARVAPDVIVADFAPACLMAARGRVPTVAVGDGFTLPPVGLKSFTPLDDGGGERKFKEDDLLSVVNGSLQRAGLRPLDFLPEMFAADRSCASSFTELDPYRDNRNEPLAAPWVPEWDQSVPMAREEVFGYFSVEADVRGTALAALAHVAREGIPVRIYVPQLKADAISWLAQNRIQVEPAAIPFEEIQRRARLVVSLGSFGFVSCALAVGIPQIVIPLGIAKGSTGMAIERLGVGRWTQVGANNPVEAALLGQVIIDAFNSEQFAQTAQRLAPDFARRLQPSSAETIAGLVAKLL